MIQMVQKEKFSTITYLSWPLRGKTRLFNWWIISSSPSLLLSPSSPSLLSTACVMTSETPITGRALPSSNGVFNVWTLGEGGSSLGKLGRGTASSGASSVSSRIPATPFRGPVARSRLIRRRRRGSFLLRIRKNWRNHEKGINVAFS